MKKNIIALLVLMLQSTFLLGQNLSVYGLELGDSKYRVEAVLESKGKTVSSGTTKKGSYLRVTYPNIGGVEFDHCNCSFNHRDELYIVTFSSNDAGLGTAGMPWESAFRSKTNECKRAFSAMLQNLTMKYGQPSMASEEYVTWQINDQRIILEFAYRYNREAYNTIDHAVSVILKYEKVDYSSVDY